MIRLTTIVILAFLIIIQALEEDHILVYAHQGGEAGHKSLHNRGDKYTSTLHPKELHDFTNIGAPRKPRPGRTTRTMVARTEKKKQVTAPMNNDNFGLKISKHLMVERKLGFYKKSKSSSLKLKHKKNKSSGGFVASYDDYRGPARHPPRHNL